MLEDDASVLQSICTKMATLPGQMLPEGELKQFYQFKSPSGHRYWRKMRAVLIKQGCVECFAASIQVRACDI
jgi:hypothetical protein